MKKSVKKLIFLIPLVILLLCTGICAKIYFDMPLYAFVEDSSWRVLKVDKDIKKAKPELLGKKIRLKIVSMNITDSTAEEEFMSVLKSVRKAKKIILNPVITAFCNKRNINVKEYLSESYVACMGKTNPNNRYDYVFKEFTDTIWDFADEYSRNKVNIKLCKTAKEYHNLLKTVNSKSVYSVIADYKLCPSVPMERLAGYIAPDFTEMFLRESAEKEGDITYVLVLYEKNIQEKTSDTEIISDEEKNASADEMMSKKEVSEGVVQVL